MELSAIQLVVDICRETRVPCHIGDSCHWEEHKWIGTSYQKERMKVGVILNSWSKWEWSLHFLCSSPLCRLCSANCESRQGRGTPSHRRDLPSLSQVFQGCCNDTLLNMIMRWRQRHMIHMCNSGCSIKEQMTTFIHETFVEHTNLFTPVQLHLRVHLFTFLWYITTNHNHIFKTICLMIYFLQFNSRRGAHQSHPIQMLSSNQGQVMKSQNYI